MKELILVKMGELALKGLNRSSFESALIRNMRRRLQGLGSFEIKNAQSTLYVEPKEAEFEMDEVLRRLSQVFGIAALSRACVVPKDIGEILETAPAYLEEQLRSVCRFKVEAKRSDKTFLLKSPQICALLGERILEKYDHLKVDVHHPELTVVVEVRDFGAYIHAGSLPGAGGMPVGTAGKAALLLSGGIDSPVAGYMMAKRGLQLMAVHFVSPPYTSERAELKVVELAKQVSRFSGRIRLFVVPFTQVQMAIKAACPENLFTLVMRRYMMRIAEILARQFGAGALITGESLGQVASQTLPALSCTDAVCEMPVLRPLIGMDKEEIVAISRRIDTFETSIQPYEDCCTVFTPKHPRTNPKLNEVAAAEEPLSPELIAGALEGVREQVVDCMDLTEI